MPETETVPLTPIACSAHIDVAPCSSLENYKSSNDIFENKSIEDIKHISLVSLFCGAGGLDLGFKQAGFNTAIAFDINESAVNSFNKNHSGNVASVVDIEQEGADGILALVKEKIPAGADIGIIGGPPCQGFSLANVSSNANDPRNKLPKIYLKIVEKLMSVYNVHFLLMENVSGIKAQKHSKTFDGIIDGIKGLNLTPRYEIMNSVHYGVAQVRKRMILLGMRDFISKRFKFPQRGEETRTVRQVIANFPDPVFYDRTQKEVRSSYHANHWTMMPKSEKFRADYIAPANSRSFKRIEWDLPSKTIAFGNREILIHPSGVRRLSIYEALLLQGFPENFLLTGSLSAQVTQVSNAVPPPLAKSIADALKKAIIAES
jgi:DNA (cytosine-5)-methyltransferase 1